MTNSDKVFSFVKANPGHSQREISSRLNISPEQQVNTILHHLVKEGSVDRQHDGHVYRYSVSLKANERPRRQTQKVAKMSGETARPVPGTSKEQQEAEVWLLEQESRRLGLQQKLAKKRLSSSGKSWLELDGFCADPLVLCEAWAHIGTPKPAQKNKVMADALKLLFANTLLGAPGKRILLFGDTDAALHFKGKSWMAECLKKNNVVIEVIEFTPEWRDKVQRAQKRQYR